jgi:hypothetical protein
MDLRRLSVRWCSKIFLIAGLRADNWVHIPANMKTECQHLETNNRWYRSSKMWCCASVLMFRCLLLGRHRLGKWRHTSIGSIGKHYLKETVSHRRDVSRLTRNSSPVEGNWGINLMTFTTMDAQQHDGWSRNWHKCGFDVHVSVHYYYNYKWRPTRCNYSWFIYF